MSPALDLDMLLAEVDRLCLDRVGLDRDSLPDWNWADAHEDGLSPLEALEAMYEDHFGEAWAVTNGAQGAGA